MLAIGALASEDSMESNIAADDLFAAALASHGSLTGETIAALVDEHLAALWRGDETEEHPFHTWLSSCWRFEPPCAPGSRPVAQSVLAAGGYGIHWFEMGSAIIGIVPGYQQGHYRIPTVAIPPNGASADAAPAIRPH